MLLLFALSLSRNNFQPQTLTTFSQKFENWKFSDSEIWTISEIIREKKLRSLDRRGMMIEDSRKDPQDT